MKKDYKIDIKKLPDSMVEINGELPWDAFKAYEQKAFSHLAANLEVDGFRKGNIPDAVAKKHINDELVLTEMAELALSEYYPTIATEHELDLIGRPHIALTKLARDNNLGFQILAAVVPEIKLPNYKKLAQTIPMDETPAVTDEDVEKVVQELRQLKAYGHVHASTDAHEHTEELPEVTDEFAKAFGNFASVAELREKIKENLTQEKGRDALDKRRVQILDTLLKETTFEIPEILIQSEQEKMISQIEAEITRARMTLEDYLKKSEKTRGALLEDYKPEAERRARMQLLINAIAKDANISPTDQEVDAEAERIMTTYPGADLERTKAYADMLLTNEKVLTMLETQK